MGGSNTTTRALASALGASLLLAACVTTTTTVSKPPAASEKLETSKLYAGRSTATFGTQMPVATAEEAALRARAASAAGDVDMTLYYLLQAAELDPADGDPLLNVGIIHESRGRIDLARSAYELGLKREPGHPGLQERLGLVCVQLGDDGRARELLEPLAVDPAGSWQVQNALGILADRAGRHADALAYFDLALEREPKAAPALNNRGYSRLLAGDVAGAEADFRATLQLTELASARANLGVCQARQKRYGAALDELLKVLPVPEALNKVGEAALANEDLGVAREYFERAAEASPRWYEKAHANLLVVDARQSEERARVAAATAAGTRH
jgi:tetratricopeptide (TPR) repeat protein